MGCKKFYQGLTDKLVAFAQSEKHLNSRQKDGKTTRQHYEAAQRSGAICELLKQPEVPLQVKYVWNWYCIARRTTSPLTWSELKAWAELTGRSPNAWEIATMCAIDRVITND